MQIIIYRARSRDELFKIRHLLSKQGIASTIVGDPDMAPAPGTKVRYLVELAVDTEHSTKASEIISEHAAAGDARVRHLTKPIRRGVALAVLFTVLLGGLGLFVNRDLTLLALPMLFIGVIVTLTIIANTKSWIRERRRDSGKCMECGYSLRGNRSGRCPECGTPTRKRSKQRPI